MVKKLKKKKSRSVRFVTFLFTVVCIIYVYRYFAYKVEIEMVKNDTMENSIPAQAVLIKNEWSVSLPAGSAADYKVNEGDRVSVGKEILKISDNNSVDENISLKLNKINERIEEIKKAEADNNFFAADKQKVDASLQSSLNDLKTVVDSGGYSKLEGVKSELAADVYKKSLISGTDSFSGQNLEALMKEKANLEQIQKNDVNTIYAMTGGLVSYKLDGYEEVLKPENIKALKAASILEIINDLNGKNKNKAEEAIEGVKVVDNFEWYIAAVIPKKIVTADDIGKSIRVRFKDNNGAVVNGTLSYFEQGNEQGNLIVVKTSEQLKGFQEIRTANVEIITKFSEGLIVPIKSIVEKNGIKGIFIERSGIARFVPINVSISNDKEALVENLGKDDKGYDINNFVLKPYDRVILSVNKIKENQMLPGAF